MYYIYIIVNCRNSIYTISTIYYLYCGRSYTYSVNYVLQKLLQFRFDTAEPKTNADENRDI